MTAFKVLLLFALVSSASAKPLRVGYLPWIGWSPLNVAEEKGFWKQQGLEVDLVQYDTQKEADLALKEGKLDLCFRMIGDMADLSIDGVPLKILGEMDWSNGGDKIIVNSQMLQGKKYAGSRIGIYGDGSGIQYFVDRFLSRHGTKLNEVTFTVMEPRALANAFLDRRFDIIVDYDPHALRVEREGQGVIVATSASFPGVIPEGVCMRAGKGEVSMEEQKKFFRGWMKALRWISNPKNIAEYRNILNKTIYANQKYGMEDILQLLGNISLHDASRLADRNAMGGGLYWYLEDLRRFYKRTGKVKGDFSSEDLMATEALLAVLAEESHSE